MLKIGIATFHYVDNYGAVLQSYALRKIINSFSNCRAEIINYIPANQLDEPSGYIEYDPALFKQKRKEFWRFLHIQCGISYEIIDSIEGNNYDVYCIGSDQVWKPINSNKEYLLPNLNMNDYCIAYAPSFGVSLDKCKKAVNFYGNHLKKFKSVSVREENYVEFVEELSGKKCYHVLDPALLLSSLDYKDIMTYKDLVEEDFVFFFWLEHDDNLMRGVEFVNSIARKYNLKIIHSIVGARNYMFCNSARCMMYEGVENFLWYIQHAKMVVTNSYHGTLFSILFHTPFYIMIVDSMRGRIDTLNNLLGLQNRIVEGYLPIEDVHFEVDFKSIDLKVEALRKESLGYLKSSLGLWERE